MNRKITVMSAIAAASFATSHAATTLIPTTTIGVAADTHPKDGVGDTTNSINATTVRAGTAGSTNFTRGQSIVIAFALPTLGVGESISTTSGLNVLGFNFESYTGANDNGNLDLYGVRFSSSSMVLASDYFSGTLDATRTLIQDSILLQTGATDGAKTTNSGASVTLGTFVNSLYTAGAVGGDFAFLRLNVDAETLSVNGRGFNISGIGATSPTLTLDVIPEPSTALLVAIGALTLLRRRVVTS